MAVHYQVGGGTVAEISASVEQGVRAGALPAGALLPTVRALAATLGVSPATVAGAYRSLRARGLVETAGRAGTRIRPRPPVASRMAGQPPVPAGLVDLSAGGPAVDLLPDLGPALARVAASMGRAGYEAAGPLPALTGLARSRLLAEGVPVGPGGLTVTSGALDAIERRLGAHLRPGDRVAVEDPGWANLLDLVAALGLVPVGVEVDDAGPIGDSLAAALAAGVAAVIVTTRAQNPTGAAVTAGRARALRGLLRAHPGVLLIEDDHAAELAGAPAHPLAGAVGHWGFVRSVAKPYGPDLRLAVLAGDEATIARVEGRMRLGAGWVSTVLQRLMVEAMTDPAVEAAVAAAGASYDRRRDGLLAALAARGVTARGASGINVWVPVPDETAVVARLRDDGFAVAPGSLYRLSSRPGVRITVSALEPAAVTAVADAVARAVLPARQPPVAAAR